MRVAFEKLVQLPDAAFIIFVIASRVPIHFGYYGLEIDRIFTTFVIIAVAAITILRRNKVIKWIVFFILSVVLCYSTLQSFRLLFSGNSISTLSLSSLILLAAALLSLSQVSVRKKFNEDISCEADR